VRICVCGVDGGVKVDPPLGFLIAAGGSKILAGGFNPPNPPIKYSPGYMAKAYMLAYVVSVITDGLCEFGE